MCLIYLDPEESEDSVLVGAVDHAVAFHHIQGALSILVHVHDVAAPAEAVKAVRVPDAEATWRIKELPAQVGREPELLEARLEASSQLILTDLLVESPLQAGSRQHMQKRLLCQSPANAEERNASPTWDAREADAELSCAAVVCRTLPNT
jgi:hypothetical protein